MFLNLGIPEVAFSSAINFSRLIELNLSPYFLDYHFLESLMRLLHNSPKLKVLMIDSTRSGILLLSWNQPSSVPECLLSHLEIFEWEGCGGGREEKEFVAYVLANSKCLKTVGISKEKKEKMMEELESMYRVSASSQLMETWRHEK
ncbi:hypothetical protein AALP_AAs50016U000100 [Arabis alpina]|uniref:FBD domain-containing protein n=1 Tax=Arabis alpina TaxID=50452 RepID=A0A087FWR3_ARAAL|nr:hypothetical protein AALP_AAs50016U000100 [Arabis alpina]